jgi:hypothetical protein
MYPEVKTIRRSQHALKQLQGILPVLKSHVLPIENHVTCHYQRHRFEKDEPPIDAEYSMVEAMTILKAAAHTLDQQTGLSFHGPPTVANINMDATSISSDPAFGLHQDALDDFADYCLDTMDPSSSEPMVSFIKRFQNRGRETGPAEPCKHAACSRTHPTNECCICRGPHFVNRCWHVLGLPDGIAVMKETFKKQHAANDRPWKRQQHQQHQNDRGRKNSHHDRPPRHNDRPRVSAVLPHYDASFEEPPQSYSTILTNSVANIQTPPARSSPKLHSLRFAPGTTTATHNVNGPQSVQQEAIDYVQEEPLQGYRSPLVNHFINPPSVASIIDHHSTLLMPLPDDGPEIDDDVLDALYNEHLVSRVAIALPPCG